MEITTLLEYSDRSQLRAWLEQNHSTERECWVVMSRSKTPPAGYFHILMLSRKRFALVGSTALSKGFRTAVWLNDSPLAARKAIGLNSISSVARN